MTAPHAASFSTEELERLRALARRLVRPEDADDLAHDAWLAGHAARHDGSAAWWRTVLRRRRAMWARASHRRAAREERASAPEAPAMDPEAEVERVRLCAALDAALARLSEEDRALVVHRYCEDHNATELSGALGLSPSAVRTRLSRSLQRLRHHLDEHYGGRSSWIAAAVAWSPQPAPLPATTVVMATSSSTTKLAAGIAVAIGIAVTVWTLRDGRAEPVESSSVVADAPSAPSESNDPTATPESASEPSAAPEPALARKQWEARRAAITSRRAQRRAAPPAEEREAEAAPELPEFGGAIGPVGQLIEQGVPLFVECLEVLPKEGTGKLHLRANLIGEPDVGGIVESVDIVDDSLDMPEVLECLQQSAYAIALDRIDEPTNKSVDIELDLAERTLNVGTQLDLEHLDTLRQQQPELWAEMLEDPEVLASFAELLKRPEFAELNPELAGSIRAALTDAEG